MLSLNIIPVCNARGIKSPRAFLTRNGFTNSMANQIVSGQCMQPKLAYIEKLSILLSCTPHDLLEWKPTEGQSKDIALAILMPKAETGFEWINDLHKLPLDKIRSLSDIVKDK